MGRTPVNTLNRSVSSESLAVPEGQPWMLRRGMRWNGKQDSRCFWPIPMCPWIRIIWNGRFGPWRSAAKNWLFCWTEVGARHVGIIYSLLASCRLQGVDPYVYLVDVLQRVDTHPALEVQLLTPRLWKQHFAEHPLRSDLDRLSQ